METLLIYKGESSNKFWKINVAGKSFTVTGMKMMKRGYEVNYHEPKGIVASEKKLHGFSSSLQG